MNNVNGQIEQASRRGLDRLLRELIDHLVTARDRSPSPELLHDMRVAVRRTKSALFLCKELLRKSDRRWFERHCDRLRTASNAVRDCDVVLEWLDDRKQNSRSQKMVRKRRERAQSRLTPLIARLLKHGRIQKRSERLYRLDTRSGASGLMFQLLKLTSRFTELSAKGLAHPDSIHRWRVTGKQLRYALDFLVDLGCDAHVQGAQAALEELQDRLGSAVDKVNRHRLLGKPRVKDRTDQVTDSDEMRWFLECIQTVLSGALAAALWCIEFDRPLFNTPPDRALQSQTAQEA